MTSLGWLYEKGLGVPQDYAKAREWYEKSAARGGAIAKAQLETLPISEAFGARRYAEALRLTEARAAKVEAAETKGDGAPGEQTKIALTAVSWAALLAQEFSKALVASERGHGSSGTASKSKPTGRTPSCSWDRMKRLKRSTLPTRGSVCPRVMGGRYRSGLCETPGGGLDAPNDGEHREGVGHLALIGAIAPAAWRCWPRSAAPRRASRQSDKSYWCDQSRAWR